MSLRSIRFRIDAFPQILLAAALTAAAGAAPARLGHRFARADAGAGRACADPKRSFDDTPLPAATPAATPTPESATPAGTARCRRTRRRPPAPESAAPAGTGSLPPRTAAPAPAPAPTAVPAATAAPATADPVVIMPTAEDTKACLDKLRKGRHGQRPDARRLGQVHRRRQAAADHGVLGQGQPEGREAGGTTSPRRSTTSAWPTAR